MNDPKENKQTDTGYVYFSNQTLLPEIIRLLDQGHTVTLRLRGYSMRPFLEDNRDKALLCKTSDPHIGDPVLAEIAPEKYVLHRIIAMEGDTVTLLGDGNIHSEHCCLKDIKAQVIGFYRKGSNRLDRTDDRKWHIYSYWWMRLLPIRRYLLAAYRRIWIPLFGAI